MDALIFAAARALAAGDPLGALQHVALRDDAPALGSAMAQLGDLRRAKRVAATCGTRLRSEENRRRARCVVAGAEIALVSRDLAWRPKALEVARRTLASDGDRVNAAYARHLAVSGLESNGDDQFFCGGATSGKLRTIRRPKRATR
jgi:hypothetical protein